MDFDSMTRAELVQYLESWGFACFDDDESTEELRVAAKMNASVEDCDE